MHECGSTKQLIIQVFVHGCAEHFRMAGNARNTLFRQTVPFTMHRVTALSVANATEEFAQHGLNVHGARVMVVLLQNPNVRVGEIAEITCIELSTLSHMLRRFERDGLITRRRPPDDNRSVIVALTARGRRVAADVHEIVKSHQTTMLAGIPAGDIAVLRRVLDLMAANVEAAARRIAEPGMKTVPARRRIA